MNPTSVTTSRRLLSLSSHVRSPRTSGPVLSLTHHHPRTFMAVAPSPRVVAPALSPSPSPSPPPIPTSSLNPSAVHTSASPSGGISLYPAHEFNFAISPIPKNPLGEGKCIRTAAALIIGDEILNGKTHDRNSNYFARYCFEQGIDLKRIEVIADEEDQIIEASRRMVRSYDFVITSGGIGPTHDDITYASLAKAFNQTLVHHAECLHRMEEMNKHRPWVAVQNEEQRAATRRMALFPDKAEVLFIAKDVWVPVVRLEGKLCIFPGIPMLFQKMLTGLTPFLPLPPKSERPLRLQIFTPRPESLLAPYLTDLQKRLRAECIQVGSYPVLGQGVYVSLIGRNQDRVKEVAEEVEKEVDGRVVSEEELRKRKEEAEMRRREGK